MPASEQDVKGWRARIMTDAKQAQRDLDALEKADHAAFVGLCQQLAGDSNTLVKHIALRKLGQRGDRGDPIAEANAIDAIGDPDTQFTALFALGRVGTPHAFPILLAYAKEGSSIALKSVSDQVRTEPDAEQVLELARQFIMLPGSKGFRLREVSLDVLIQHSTAEAEQETLLASARLFADDFVVKALAEASVNIIPELVAIRNTYPQLTVEYESLSNAIHHLEQRKSGASDQTN